METWIVKFTLQLWMPSIQKTKAHDQHILLITQQNFVIGFVCCICFVHFCFYSIFYTGISFKTDSIASSLILIVTSAFTMNNLHVSNYFIMWNTITNTKLINCCQNLIFNPQQHACSTPIYKPFISNHGVLLIPFNAHFIVYLNCNNHALTPLWGNLFILFSILTTLLNTSANKALEVLFLALASCVYQYYQQLPHALSTHAPSATTITFLIPGDFRTDQYLLLTDWSSWDGRSIDKIWND